MALVLLAAAALFAVAWVVQGDDVEPVAEPDAPLESETSFPAPAPTASDDSTARDGEASSGPDPDVSLIDQDADGAAGNEDSTGVGDSAGDGDPAGVGDPPGDQDPAADGDSAGDGDPAGVGDPPGDQDPAADGDPAGDGDSEGDGDPSGDGDAAGNDDRAVADTDTAGGEGSVAEAVSGTEDGRTTPGADDATADESEPDAVDGRAVAPLTGELTGDTTLAQRRALAIKVGNGQRKSRPQAGLAAADIVYETLIEGGESRFTAVFHSEIPGRIGPVRSVRSSDFDLLAGLSTPYLASSGANTTVLAQMRRAVRAGTVIDVGGLRNFEPFSRDPSRRRPFNLYFYYNELADSDGALPGGPLAEPVPPLLAYGSPNPSGLEDAIGVTVTFHRRSGNVISHIWDAAVGGWVRIQEGALMMTETEFGLTEVAPVNVAVMWMPHKASAAHVESPQALSYGTGDALVLTSGAVHDAVWERTEDCVGFRFSDVAGNPLSLSPGSTWLLIANTSRRYPVTVAEVLTTADGARLLADAREAAQ